MNKKFKDDFKINISVIIPCYNGEKNIIGALESLENQTYKEFEVIVVNDGSVDNSDKVINKYLNESKLKYKYFYQNNKGVSSARNEGIKNADGKYITFLDSDDIYHSEYLQELVALMEGNDVDTAYCSYSRDISELTYKKDLNKSFTEYLNHSQLLNNFMYRKGPCGFFNFIYKKSILYKNNIWFEENTKYGEDLEFTWKYLINCKSGIFLDKKLYGYYDNPDSAVNNVSWRITDVLDVIKRVEDYMYEKNDMFINEFKKYMYDRTIWAVAKDFCVNNKDDLFDEFIKKFEVKKSMKNMAIKGPHLLIKISAILFLLNPKIFYKVTASV